MSLALKGRTPFLHICFAPFGLLKAFRQLPVSTAFHSIEHL